VVVRDTALTNARAPSRVIRHSLEQVVREIFRFAPAFGRLRVCGHRALVWFTAEGAFGGVAIRGLIGTHSRLPSRNSVALQGYQSSQSVCADPSEAGEAGTRPYTLAITGQTERRRTPQALTLSA
jgi:hypothetical protein